MKLYLRTAPACLLALTVALSATSGQAAFLIGGTGSWSFAQNPGGVTSFSAVSPGNVTVGNGSANNADGVMFASTLSTLYPSITLANSGDKIIFDGNVTISGMVNNGASTDGQAAPRTQFRFGLFDTAGSSDDNGWVGYTMLNSHGTGTPNGSLTRKNPLNTNLYQSTTAGANSMQATSGTQPLFHDGTYTMSMTIERSGNDLIVSSSLTRSGSPGFSQVHGPITHVGAATGGWGTFNRVGFLLGANIDTDQAVFSNLRIRTNAGVPEPATWLLGLGSLLGGALVRRRSRVA